MFYLQQDVNSLHPLLLNTGDAEVNSQVQKLLLRLGVKQLSPSDVINHHIIPVLKSDTWQVYFTLLLHFLAECLSLYQFMLLKLIDSISNPFQELISTKIRY